MRLILVCLLLVGIAPVATSAASIKLTPTRPTFLSKAVRKCGPKGTVVCRQNDVSVVERKNEDGTWTRGLRFGDECATETQVVCQNQKPCGTCGKCPCDFDARALPWSTVNLFFEQLTPSCLKADSRVLILGLGGGALPQRLLHKCPGMHIDAVELNGDVITMARTYFGVEESENEFGGRFNIEQADALVSVRRRAGAASFLITSSYDAVVIDCFSGGGRVPESCRSQELAEKIKHILKTDGILLQNIWHDSYTDRVQIQQEFQETKTIYSNVFDGALDVLPLKFPPPPHSATRPEDPLDAIVRDVFAKTSSFADILRATKKHLKDTAA